MPDRDPNAPEMRPWPSLVRAASAVGCAVDRVRMDVRGLLRLRLTSGTGQTIDVGLTEPRPHGPRPLATTSLGNIGYRECVGIERQAAADLCRRFGRALDQETASEAGLLPHRRVRLSGVAGDAFAAVADVAPTHTLELTASGVSAWLAPELTVGGPAFAGWQLQAPLHARNVEGRPVIALTLARDGDAVPLLVTEQDTALPTFGVAGALAVSLVDARLAGGNVPAHVALITSWLLVLLARKQGPTFALLAAPPEGDETGLSERPNAPTQWANLVIDTECGQSCTFCTIKTYLQPTDRGTAGLNTYRRFLQTARDNGAKHVRLNGIDPLTFSRVLDTVRTIDELGFDSMHVYSPAGRFADASFAAAFVQAAPRQTRVYIPLYGASAEVHDGVTGSAGSFGRVLTGIANLRAAKAPGKETQLHLATVVTAGNLHGLAELQRLADELELPLGARLAYPMRRTVVDAYSQVAVRESALMGWLLRARDTLSEARSHRLTQLVLDALPHPCIIAAQAPELVALGPPGGHRPSPLTGTRSTTDVDEGEDDEGGLFIAATHPCEHVSNCSLSHRCCGEFYADYVRLYGTDEFQPPAAD